MIKLLRKILFPFAILYGFVTGIRNFLFDKGILKSYSFDIPIIAVGNLSVGGTGKTPQIEYLIRLLSSKYNVATLSRGYKRKSKGFVLANSTSNAEILGDEPFQFYTKFKTIQVAVDADRKNGIDQLLSQKVKPDVILLDDAYQHRKVKAGFYILLSSFGDFYSDDFMLPTGNLREGRSGVKRANVIIITKCPVTLSVEEQNKIRYILKLEKNQDLYFSYIEYDDFVYAEEKKISVTEIKKEALLLLAGIAKPEPFFEYLKGSNNERMIFPDHHHFDKKDLIDIADKAKNKIIITTEKDYVRLKYSIVNNQLFYLPIQCSMLSKASHFDKLILDYVEKSSKKV